MREIILPQTYQEWRNCISVKCKIELTQNYISNRISELKNEMNSNTQKFIQLYGYQYYQLIINWFIQEQESINKLQK